MQKIKFDPIVAQETIRRLNNIKQSLDSMTIRVEGTLDDVLGTSVNDVIRIVDGTKLFEFNRKKQTISKNISRIIDGIKKSGEMFANVELDIVQGANRTEGEI